MTKPKSQSRRQPAKDPYISHPITAIARSLERTKSYALKPALKVGGLIVVAYAVLATAFLLISGAAVMPILMDAASSQNYGSLTEAEIVALGATFSGALPLYIIAGIGIFLPLTIALDYLFTNAQYQKTSSFKESVLRGYRRIPSAVGAYALAAVIVLGGLFLYIIPGIYLLLRFSYLRGVIAYDDTGPIESLKRSWNLTRGTQWDIIGVVSVGAILGLLLSLGEKGLLWGIGNPSYDSVSYVTVTVVAFLVNLAIGLLMQIAILFRFMQSAEQGRSIIKKDGTHPLNYWLPAGALVLLVADALTPAAEPFAPTNNQ